MQLTTARWFLPGRITLWRKTRHYYPLYTAPAGALQELCSLHSERPFLSAHEANAIGGALSILAFARGWPIVETVIPDATVLPYELAPPPRIF
jgi:hypothetical protein